MERRCVEGGGAVGRHCCAQYDQSHGGAMPLPAACISRVQLCGKEATLAVAHSTCQADQWQPSKSFRAF